MTPQETDPDLSGSVHVSSVGLGWWWPAAGLGALNAAMHAWDVLKEVAIIFLTSAIVRSEVAQSCPTLCDPMIAARQASLSITNSWSLLKLMSIELVMLSNHLILCHPFLLPPSILPSIRVFSNESALRIRWLKYWSFSFSISPSNGYSGLISFRMDWLDLLAPFSWVLVDKVLFVPSKSLFPSPV